MKLKYLLACLAAFPLTSAFAQQDIETLQVTGSRIDNSQQGSFSTLSKQQIEKINPASTLDLLRRIPNIIVAQNGAAGGVSFVSLRGGESNFTLVMIDGIAVNDSTNSRGGGFDFSQINPDAIQRIEVYRGGISAIHGGEAISGVIHIITTQASSSSVAAELGTDEQTNARLNLAKQFDNGLYTIASLSSRQRQTSDFAKQDSQQALFKLGLDRKNSQHQLLVTISDADNRSFAEDSGGELFAVPRVAEERSSKQWILGLSNTFAVSSQTDIAANASWVNREETAVSPGIADGVLSGIPASNITSEFDRVELEIYATHAVNDGFSIVVGANQRKLEGTNDGELDFGFPLPVDFVLEQDSHSAFAEGQYDADNLSVNLGWRYDDADNFDSETSLRFSADYAFGKGAKVFGVYNEGYKLPSFFALAHPLVGNAQLRPERSENVEFGVTFQQQSNHLTLMVFDNHFTDLVDFDAELFTNVNRNSVDASGLEINTALMLASWLELRADLSYVEINVDGQTSQLRRRPQWYGGLTLDADWQQFTLTLFADFRDRYLDSSIATGLVELGGYVKYGVTGRWQMTEQLSSSVSIDNLTARDYQESVGFVNDEANLRVGMTYRF